jgi:hypothetical protein
VPASKSSLPPRAPRNLPLSPTNQFSQKGAVERKSVRHVYRGDVAGGGELGDVGTMSGKNAAVEVAGLDGEMGDVGAWMGLDDGSTVEGGSLGAELSVEGGAVLEEIGVW